MSDTIKTGESIQELQDCIRDLLAERARERKFQEKSEQWLEAAHTEVTNIRSDSEYKDGWHDAIVAVYEHYCELKAQHLASEKESEGEHNDTN